MKVTVERVPERTGTYLARAVHERTVLSVEYTADNLGDVAEMAALLSEAIVASAALLQADVEGEAQPQPCDNPQRCTCACGVAARRAKVDAYRAADTDERLAQYIHMQSALIEAELKRTVYTNLYDGGMK